MRFLIALAFFGVAPAVAGGMPIELWTRSPGNHDSAVPPRRERVVTVDLDRLPLQEAERADLQYGVTRPVRFVAVEELIRRYAPPPGTDLALLHFTNGMIIPLPFRDRAVMDRLRPVVVRAVKLGGSWTTALPDVRREEIGFADARPLRFHGNKLLVAERWHPDLQPGTEDIFTPFRHADTLDGIELVDGAAWRAQFDVDAETRAGLEVFQRTCAFCHGARRVGAQLGWDFVEPIAISEYRKKDASLYYHLRYRAADAPVRGLLMPALPFLTEKDAADVLAWLRALAARPLNAYTPAH